MKIFGKFRYYLSQARLNIKKNILILITFGICFSMVAGIAITTDSFQNYLLIQNEGIENIPKLTDVVLEYDELSHIDSKELNQQLENVISTSDFKHIEDEFQFTTLISYGVSLFRNDSLLSNEEKAQYPDYFETQFSSIIAGQNFYTSHRFNESFSIIKGTYPTAHDEILVDYLQAKMNNYKLGDHYNITLNVAKRDGDIEKMNIPQQLKVVGIYTPKNESRFEINGRILSYGYSYNKELDQIQFLNGDGGGGYLTQNSPIFSYFDYEDDRISDNAILMKAVDIFHDRYVYPIWVDFSSGYCINFDFSQLKFNQFNDFATETTQNLNNIQSSYQYILTVQSYAIDTILSISSSFNLIRFVVQIFSLPLIIFAIVMGSIAIKNETRNRMQEYLLLRSKGTSTKIIQKQMIVESFILSIVASILGFLLGIPVFYGLRLIVNEIFTAYDISNLDLLITLNPIIATLITGIIAVLTATISSMVLIKRLPAQKILRIIGQSAMDAKYDEKSVFGLADAKSNPENPTKDENKSRRDRRRERKLQKIYQKALADDDKRKNRALLYFILGLIPIVFTGIQVWAGYNTAPDLIQNIYSNAQQFFMYSSLLIILTPFFLSVAIIQFIGIEKPEIYANLSNRLTKPFLGRISRLLGLENIRRRQYITVTKVLAVFVSLILFVNIFIFSFLNIPVVEKNVESGADLNISYSSSTLLYDYYGNYDPSFNPYADLPTLEYNLSTLQNSQNESVVEDVLTLYLGVDLFQYDLSGFDPIRPEPDIPFGASGDRFSHFLIYTNISKLLHFISEGKQDYLELNPIFAQFEDQISKSNGSNPFCLISENLLISERKSPGDLLDIPHTYYNQSDGEYYRDGFQAIISEAVDEIPGLWLKRTPINWEESYYSPAFQYSTTQTGYVLMDISVLESIPHNLNNYTYASMIDLKDEYTLNEDEITYLNANITGIVESYGWGSSNRYYFDSYDEYRNAGDFENQIFLVSYGFIFEFGGIGIVIAISLAVLIISFQKTNKFFNGVLLSRGFGKHGLLKFVASLIFTIFSVGLLVGSLIGSVTGVLAFKSQFFLRSFLYYDVQIPLSINILPLVAVLILIPLFTYGMYLVNYVVDSRKSVSEYFNQF